MIKYTNDLIWIYKHLINKRKLVEKLRWYTYKITSTSVANYDKLQNLVPKKCDTLSFGQND